MRYQMDSYSSKRLESLIRNAEERGREDVAAEAREYLPAALQREFEARMLSSRAGRAKLASGYVLEVLPVREHERDGVTVSEHFKGYWVRKED